VTLIDRIILKKLSIISSIIIISLLGTACSTIGDSDNQNQFNKQDEVIAFIHFKFQKNGDTISINQDNCELTAGKLKDDHNRDTIAAPGYLIFKLVDNKYGVVKRIILENPLDENMEFVNSKNELERKMIYHKEIDFQLRLQYNIAYKYLMIDLLDANLNTNTIFFKMLKCGEKDEK
jgi:hypothetical protein